MWQENDKFPFAIPQAAKGEERKENRKRREREKP
jgi:hypothetical protein